MELLIILFIIFVEIPAILPRILLFLAKRKMRSTMNKMYEQQQRQQQQQQRQAQSNHPNDTSSRPRKKINKDVGEYVNFEEITDNNPAQNTDSNNPSQSTPVEPQISDADWEEIK